MSRKLRIWYPGATYHITARGDKHSPLFFMKQIILRIYNILEDVRTIYPFVLHFYCLMTNHIHFQLETIHHHILPVDQAAGEVWWLVSCREEAYGYVFTEV
jgi:putative transposase